MVDHDGAVYVHFLNTRSTPLQEVRVDSHDCLCTKFNMVEPSVARLYDSFGFKLSWSPVSDGLLAIPTKTGVILLSKNNDLHSTWSEKFLIGSGDLTHGHNSVNIAQFSPDGKYLASADTRGVVIIWVIEDMEKECPASPVRLLTVRGDKGKDEPLFDLVWGPKEGDDYLIAVTKTSWVRIPNAVTSKSKVGQSNATFAETSSTQVEDIVVEGGFAAMMKKQREEAIGPPMESTISASEDAFQSTQVEQPLLMDKPLPRKRLQKSSSGTEGGKPSDDNDKDDEISGGGNNETGTSIASIKRQGMVVADDEALIDDEEEYHEEDLNEEAAKVGTLLQKIQDTPNLTALTMELQKPFQPSSTRADEKKRRYLVWNSVGMITARDEDDESRIEIKFANQNSSNRNEVMVDHTGFVMAALSYEGAVFATAAEVDPDKNNPYASDFKKPTVYYGSTIYYKAFPNQAQLKGCNESFQVTLAEAEEAKAVAVGRGWVAVATSRQLLRIFSSTGLQLSTVFLRGPVVSLSGLGSRLAVVYHGGLPVEDSYSMKVDLYEIQWDAPFSGKVIVDNFPVPLSAKSTLHWIGFETTSLFFVAMDSAGVLMMLVRSLGWQWMPVLEVEKVRKSIDHQYWPVMVRDGTFVFVLLNGESRPAVFPTPVVSIRKLRVSLVEKKDGHKVTEANAEKAHLLMWTQAKSDHWEALKSDLDTMGPRAAGVEDASELEARLQVLQKESDKVFLTLMQDACLEKRDSVALNLAFRLRSMKAMEAGIKIANNMGRTALASALDAIIDKKLQEEQLQLQLQQSLFESAEIPSQDCRRFQEPVDSGAERGRLSSKVQSNSGKFIAPKATKTVSPNGREDDNKPVRRTDDEANGKSSMRGGSNPFAVSSSESPLKRKNAFSAIQDLKASPSPKKLAVSSSYFIVDRLR